MDSIQHPALQAGYQKRISPPRNARTPTFIEGDRGWGDSGPADVIKPPFLTGGLIMVVFIPNAEHRLHGFHEDRRRPFGLLFDRYSLRNLQTVLV
ncbi:hypothetical protein D9M70_565160 [compost metagenome]